MKLIHSQISCGVSQVYGLNDAPEDGLRDLGTKLFVSMLKPTFIVWSDSFGVDNKVNRGELLHDCIVKLFPSSNIQRTELAKNVNSNNDIRLYNWQIPRETFKGWWEKNK